MKSSAVPESHGLLLSHQFLFVQGRLSAKSSTLVTEGRWPEILDGPPWPLTWPPALPPSLLHVTFLPSFPFDTSALNQYSPPLIFLPSVFVVPVFTSPFFSLRLFSVHPVHRATCWTFLSSTVSVPLPDGWIVKYNSLFRLYCSWFLSWRAKKWLHPLTGWSNSSLL